MIASAYIYQHIPADGRRREVFDCVMLRCERGAYQDPSGSATGASRHRYVGRRQLAGSVFNRDPSAASGQACPGNPLACRPPRGAHSLLQIRTWTLDGTLRPLFERWHSGLANDNDIAARQAGAA